jgi:hypothetical protein
MGGITSGVTKTFIAYAALAIIITAACVADLTGKADARAYTWDFMNMGPNQYELPGGHVNGTAASSVVNVLGWNATATIGNVGIGNGSVSTFDEISTQDVEYPETGFMCADVSMQPWTPGKENAVETPESEERDRDNATENAGVNDSTPGANTSAPNSSDGAHLPVAGETNHDSVNESGHSTPDNAEQADAVSENITYAAYHPIRFLRPVKDVLYEHPLATPGTAYCELLGFISPSGVPVNVGMKCTGYGY